jgi:hypothetical protein
MLMLIDEKFSSKVLWSSYCEMREIDEAYLLKGCGPIHNHIAEDRCVFEASNSATHTQSINATISEYFNPAVVPHIKRIESCVNIRYQFRRHFLRKSHE